MLTEERYAAILGALEEKKAVTVAELTRRVGVSESTIRRDLAALHELGRLVKVHGGATVPERDFTAREEDIPTKAGLCVEEKQRIARYAAGLVQNDDFVYLDAGTTTESMIDYLGATRATFLTNGIVHAKKLAQRGLKVYVVGGQLKRSTEAIVGAEAVESLGRYNFSKCFLGTNGISVEAGLTTPDVEEARLKTAAAGRSYVPFVLADHTKFGKVSAVTFFPLERACVLTDCLPDPAYTEKTVVKEVPV